jgi:molybdate/tungstate transport system substrate-binding protein
MARLHPLWVVLIAALALLAGLVGGYELRGTSAPGAPASASGSPVLSITAAGTLGTAFPALAQILQSESPGVEIPNASQTYEGSLAALGAITATHGLFDVAAAADFRLIPHLLSPGFADWEVVFASNPEVLTYDPTASALTGINTTNWPTLLERSGVVLGVANASTDPNGFNEIFVLELEGLLLDGNRSAVYGHFYSGSPGAYALPDPTTTRVEPETQVASLLATHTVTAFITYRSYALTHHLSFVNLSASVNLGSFDPSDLATYAGASTTILNATGATSLVTGAPVAFSATVPKNAPNATLGALFIHLALSPQGEALLAQDGFTTIVPGYSYGSGVLPAMIAPEVVPLPSALAAEI